jgi:8-oxo-dGTP pyrophosphatase MutT (NUDIX family)
VTGDQVRARFAGHHAGLRWSDPVVGARVRGDHSLSPGPPPQPPVPLVPAAVLVPLIDRPEGLTVLLTQRTPHLAAHAGQISFPGGRVESFDGDSIAAALRETEEEVGLPPDYVEVVGRLDTYITGTGFEICPVVGLVRAPYPLKLDPIEVADAFEVPLSFILEPGNRQQQTRELRGQTRTVVVVPYQGRYIWGTTAAMLVNLAEILTQ